MGAFFNIAYRGKSTQDEKVRFIKGNESKLIQVELLSFFIFKNVNRQNDRIGTIIIQEQKFRLLNSFTALKFYVQ